MNTVRVVKNENYTTISNIFLRDKNLSIKSKGFLAVIMALKEDWVFSINGICSTLKEGKTAVYGIISELKDNGYCKVELCRNDKGVIIGNDYTFYEEPHKVNPHSENPNADNQPQLNTDSNKVLNREKKEEEEKQGWKTNFDAYYQLVVQAQHQLLHDNSCKAQKEKYHPNLDYELSLDKMVTEYWGTEKAWEHKKKSKSKDINMVTTLKKAFDVSSNRVYKKLQFGKGSERRSEPSESKAKNYTNVPLNPELKFVDKEGLLNDGTFVKNGCRYYFSKNQSQTFGIPPAAEPMPNDGNYEYSLEYGWYEVE